MTAPTPSLTTQAVIGTIVFGTTYQVQITKYGDGTREFRALQGANKPIRSKGGGYNPEKFMKLLVDQLLLVT